MLQRPETIYSIWLRSPEEALDEAFKRNEIANPYCRGELFMWVATKSITGVTYGNFKTIKRSDLKDRSYEINCFDYRVGITWLDVLLDERGQRLIEMRDPKYDTFEKTRAAHRAAKKLLKLLQDNEPPWDKKKPKTPERIAWEQEYEELRQWFIEMNYRNIAIQMRDKS